MKILLALLVSLLIAATGCASPPSVNDIKVSQAVKSSPPTWVDKIFAPGTNTLFGFDSSGLPVAVTVDTTNLTLSGNTLSINSAVNFSSIGASSPGSANFTSIGGVTQGQAKFTNVDLRSGGGGLLLLNPNNSDGLLWTTANHKIIGSVADGVRILINNSVVAAFTSSGLSVTGTVSGNLLVPNGAPATASSPGTSGQIVKDNNFLYICVGTDTWRRVALSTW